MIADPIFGRMPEAADLDIEPFDVLPTMLVNVTPDEMEALEGESKESFPTLRRALRYFRKNERNSRPVRIDTDKSYGTFMCEQAVRELERRMAQLEEALAAHEADPYAHQEGYGEDEVLGAARVVERIKNAKTPAQAARALPAVPVALPDFAKGKVKCWKDGDRVCCSVRFQAADGTARVATMCAKPKVDKGSAEAWANCTGHDADDVLGALAEVADATVAERLVKDVAGAAMAAQRRLDVCGMTDDDEPLELKTADTRGTAHESALVHLQARCEAGDQQACEEMKAIEEAARALPTTRRMLRGARQRHDKKVRTSGRKGGFIERYLQMGLCL